MNTDISVNYLGLKLAHPFMPGASPAVDDLGMVRQMEDAGASAIVMHSLFEEQVTMEERARDAHVEAHADSSAEATSYFPDVDDYALGPDQYLEQVRKIKETVAVPVIASLNGSTLGGWVKYARLIEQAGADALELNVYHLPTQVDETGADVEARVVELLQAVKEEVKLPVAVKLSPFYSSLPCLAQELVAAGASGLVLFNRFYQPDIDIDELEAAPRLVLSNSTELLLRLRWLAILEPAVKTSYAVSGGVHTVSDAVKSIMTGASAVQVVSAMIKRGPAIITELRDGLRRWLEEREYESVEQLRGSMSLRTSPDPSAFERANYLRILQGWRVGGEVS
jgi:dihydroorotate dehydrogenase (fumarate)